MLRHSSSAAAPFNCSMQVGGVRSGAPLAFSASQQTPGKDTPLTCDVILSGELRRRGLVREGQALCPPGEAILHSSVFLRGMQRRAGKGPWNLGS